MRQLPGVDSASIVESIGDSLPRGSMGLSGLLTVPEGKVREIISKKIPDEFKNNFLKVFSGLPRFIVEYSISNITKGWVKSKFSYEIKLVIRCHIGNTNAKVYCPKFHRNLTLSWFIVVGSIKDNSLLSFKKVQLNGAVTSVSVSLQSLEHPSGVVIYIFSDAISDIGSTIHILDSAFGPRPLDSAILEL